MASSAPTFAIDAIEDHKTVHLLVGGEVFDAARLKMPAGVVEFQAALVRARAKHGHALCWCKKPGLKLQIRRVDGKFHLALWPGEGQVHEHNCAFYREPIQTVSPQDMQALAPPIEAPGAASLSTVRHDMPPVRDLATMLWVQANMNRWHPLWERDWGRTRFELLRAAQHIHVSGKTLAAITFIPKPFRPNLSYQLDAQWDGFLESVAKTGKEGARPSCLIIAPVKRIHKQSDGLATMHLSHMRHPIGLERAVVDFLKNNFRTAFNRAVQADEFAHQPEVIKPKGPRNRVPTTMAVLQCRMSTKGGLWAVQGWFLPVHPDRYIPCFSTYEVALVDALLAGGYEFTRLINNEPVSQRTDPDWLVHNVQGPSQDPKKSVCISIAPEGMDKGAAQAKTRLEAQMAKGGIPTWTWVPQYVDGVIVPPGLPAHTTAHKQPKDAHAIKKRIKPADTSSARAAQG